MPEKVSPSRSAKATAVHIGYLVPTCSFVEKSGLNKLN